MKNLEKATTSACVYRITGQDALVSEQALEKIETLAGVQMPEINRAVFNDENFDVEKILLSCQQIPFLSDRRLVIVKNIAKVKESDIKKLAEYCLSPVPSTVLVFQEIIGLNVFAKLSAEKVVCGKMDISQLKNLISSAFSGTNVTITSDATQMLIDFCSQDALKIQNELSKLLHAGVPNITPDVVQKHVKKSDEFSVFEITTALSYGDGSKAITLMQKMLETMEFPVILGLISSHFRRVLYATLSGETTAEIARLLGVKEFAITKAQALGKKLSASRVLAINKLILDIDYDIKTGKMNAQNAMYFLVFKIISIVKG